MLNIPVINLLKDTKHRLHMELITGKGGLGKKLVIPRIQKPGLALTGDSSNLHPGRIQIFGRAEMDYLNSLSPQKLKKVLAAMRGIDIACIIITRGASPQPLLKEFCRKQQIPLIKTKLLTSTFVNRITRFMEESLAATSCIHGVLLDIFGIGVLIVGKSGIGKSECALDLILRGHRLVADDVINIRKRPPSSLYGSGSEIIKYHMEIRGLGIINIRDLFGISAVRDKKYIEMVIELTEWNPEIEYDRLGIDEQRYTILNVSLPLVQIPVRPGRHLSAIIEVAARNLLLKLGGHHSAQKFQEKLSEHIMMESQGKKIWGELE
ncbi:MAG TPA: HPr(Ser) kinase/phosphatase [bacterium]|nr:HPr(Ser) kinase/phosphatase [bacterium]